MPPALPLPIDAALPALLHALAGSGAVVVEAAPGAGKTTRIPPALLATTPGEVWVLEPRRLAARMAARRVAGELNEPLGQTVGYQVRFEEVSGPTTRLRFLTEGVLVRRLITNPALAGVGAVVLDEFHERHLDGDLALALVARLRATTRPDLQLIVMSATLDAAPVAHFLACRSVRAQGRAFPLTIRHMPYSPAPLAEQVRTAAEELLREGERGDILIFLPGSAEIRQAMRACESLSALHGTLHLPLYGELSPAEQDLAVGPSARQKLIFSTNVAESSLTVEGVTAVIDSGLARIARTSPWTGLSTLEVSRISRASATQRAGRAGRTAPGRVVRLFSEEDFAHRRAFDIPEILRADLGQLCLTFRSLALGHPGELRWLDPPPPEAVAAAQALLDRLGAHPGPEARALGALPLPPRLARVVVEAGHRGVAAPACLAVAVLSSGARTGAADLLHAMEGEQSSRVQQTAAQLRRVARVHQGAPLADEDALLKALLCGFPDRVARRKAGAHVLLANGITAECAGGPPTSPFLLALDAEVRGDRPQPLVRTTCRIEPDWLIELFPERIVEHEAMTWNGAAERAERHTTLAYEGLVLEEWREEPPPGAATELLMARARAEGLERLLDADALAGLRGRWAFAGLGEPDLEGAVAQLAAELSSLPALRRAAENKLLPLLEAQGEAHHLRRLAPTSVRLAGGRQVTVHYEPGKPPWIASRLQDFFGMREGPRVGREQVPVVMHLLAPNGRAVQTTSDLQGFWQRLYPQVRKELMRRYPRHAWPEQV